MINIRKLEAELWESADLLRAGSKLTSNQWPDYRLYRNRQSTSESLGRLHCECEWQRWL